MSLQLTHINKRYGNNIKCRDLNLSLDPGMFLALIAPTGAGKTTLLRIMAGLEKPDSGRVFMDGEDVTKVHVRKRNVAMVYQQFINYPSLTVFENIASPLKVAGYDASTVKTRVHTVAQQVRISEFLDRLPQQLSGGQQQRVAIARALAKDAKLILLDEPLGNLDYKLREDLRLELKTIASESEAMFVYATPEPLDALTMASHAAILEGGQIIQMGDVRSVYLRPNQIASGRYFSDPPMNFLPATVSGGQLLITEDVHVDVRKLELSLEPGDYVVGIRPHHINVTPTNADTPPHTYEGATWMSAAATVTLSEIVGSDTTVHLEHEGVKLTALSQDVGHFHLGEAVTMHLNSDYMHVFVPSGKLVASAKAVRGG
ncbi:MAG: ABC transporter ATP-binding protein [Deinococcota bacterium]